MVESAGAWPHLGFIYLAGAARQAGHEVAIYDAMSLDHTLEDIRHRLWLERPDVVGVSAKTPALYAAAAVARAAKDELPGVVTILGGIHPTFCYQQVLAEYPEVDVVVRGEGEETLPELLGVLAGRRNGHVEGLRAVQGIAFRQDGQVVATPPRRFVRNLDALAPAWDLVDWADYRLHFVPGSRVACVSSSRGCSNACAFCSQQKFWQRSHRARQAGHFLAELEHLVQRYGVNYVLLTDEYPTRDRLRWEAILDGLIERQLPLRLLIETCVVDILRDAPLLDRYRAAGVWHIYVGVEGVHQERLDLFNKHLRCEQSREAIRLINQADIITETSFILGAPDETRDTVAATLELAGEYDPDYAHFLMLAPWPFSDIYAELRPYIETDDLSRYNLVEPVLRSREMTGTELMAAAVDCYRRFYLDKLPRWDSLPAGFKREYLLGSLEAMVQRSFLQKHGRGLGEMPAEIARFLPGLRACAGGTPAAGLG